MWVCLKVVNYTQMIPWNIWDFVKWGYLKIIHFDGILHYKPYIWGTQFWGIHIKKNIIATKILFFAIENKILLQ